jgi:multidrug efflux pump subunit AcrB
MIRSLSVFRSLLLFVMAVIAGILLLPGIKLSLLPENDLPRFSLSFSFQNSSPEIIEQQVTSVLEGACSQLTQLKKIRSVSGFNYGTVFLEFDGSADPGFKQFELAGIIRQVFPQLPPGVSYPQIIKGNPGSGNQSPLLIYAVNAPMQPFEIKRKAEEAFINNFAGFAGVKEINISGPENLQLSIVFKTVVCNSLQVNPTAIADKVMAAFTESYPGTFVTDKGEQFFLHMPAAAASIESIRNIIIVNDSSRRLLLKDLASVYFEEKAPDSYFRVNGKNSVLLSIYAKENENKIALGNKIKKNILAVQSRLAPVFEIFPVYDETIFLQTEIKKNETRAALAAFILLLFILLMYRSWPFTLNLAGGLLINLCLISIFVRIFWIPIHIYSIAGLAVSFGIMTDNAIVMIDHFRRYQNSRIVSALAASTFTTLAALSLVFFLPPDEKENLADFVIIIMIALISSMITAIWFTPAFYMYLERLRKTNTQAAKPVFARIRVRRIKSRLRFIYYKMIAVLAAFRKSFVLALLLLFGLPVFLLPEKWEGNHWYNKWYNSTFGSRYYLDKIKPTSDKWLGGTLRLFVNDVFEKSGYRSPERTKLYVTAELDYGNTPAQMNAILESIEKYFSASGSIENYVTSIDAAGFGHIEISFKPEVENTALPYRLKADLINRSMQWNGAKWSVSGIGQGFSSGGMEGASNFRVSIRGYNYEELGKQASRLKQLLSKNTRVLKVNTNDRLIYEEKTGLELELYLDPYRLNLFNTTENEILESVQSLTNPAYPFAQVTFNNRYFPVFIRQENSQHFSAFNLLHEPIQFGSGKAVKADNLGHLKSLTIPGSIQKEDRQYVRIISFDFSGTPQFGNKYLKALLEDFNKTLPVGYFAHEQKWGWNRTKEKNRYSLIFILLLLIFFICSILFENLKQPFHIISIIPVSFIGLFLTFTRGGFYFDQGGYAAFVMLGGLVANAAIFIVNDFNNLRKNKPGHLYNRILIKAAAGRSRTVMLTTISTCCGLIPFLLEGQNEVFWFSLAAGTIGGLLFSLFALFIVLPVLLWKKNSKPFRRKDLPHQKSRA